MRTGVTCLRHQLGFVFLEAKTLPFASKILNMKQLHVCSSFLPANKKTSVFCMTAFAMFSAPLCSEAWQWSKTSTPKEWVFPDRGSGVGWSLLAMLNLASLQSQASASWARMEMRIRTPKEKCFFWLVLLTGNLTVCLFFTFFYCRNCDMIFGDVWVGVVVGWWGRFFPWIVLAMLWW